MTLKTGEKVAPLPRSYTPSGSDQHPAQAIVRAYLNLHRGSKGRPAPLERSMFARLWGLKS